MSIPNFTKYRLGEVAATLEKYGYPRSGTVDTSLSTEEKTEYLWLLDAGSGFYYFDGRLQYNYNDRAEETFTLAAGVNTITLTGSANPNKGPVLIYSDTEGAGGSGQVHYLPINNCLYPGYVATWTASGSYYRVQIPAGTKLINVRSLEEETLLEVKSLTEVKSEDQYFFDTATSYVYIKTTTSPNNNYYLDLIYSQPLLKFREAVIVEKEGIRPTYKYIEGITIRRGGDTLYNSGAPFFGDYLETTIEEGKWVILEYYIKYSYIQKTTTSFEVYAGYASADAIIIHYETTHKKEGLDSLTAVNLSPLTLGYKGQGFVISTDTPISSLNTPHRVVAYSDKDYLHTGVAEETLITVIVLDRSNIPVPLATISKTSSNLTAITSFPTAVDSTGKISFYVKATAAGAWSIFFTCSAINSNTISGTATSNIYTSTDYEKGYSFVTQKEGNIYCQQSRLDGLPRLNKSLTVKPKDDQEMSYQGIVYKGSFELPPSTIFDPYYNNAILIETGAYLAVTDSDNEGLYDINL